MLDVVRADFAGDNVGCWMQIQVGKGPWASEVSGLVKIGQTMTMVLAIKDDEQKFDMLVRNCMAHDGKRAPIQLVDQQGCVTRPKLMSKFNKIKNFGASASVLSYAHFQAFKFPDSMEVHFQCTIQICRYACPDQCPSAGSSSYTAPAASAPAPVKNDDYGAPAAAPQASYNGPSKARTRRSAFTFVKRDISEDESDSMGDVGIEKVIHVVSSGDLTFDIKEGGNDTVVDIYPPVAQSLHEEQVMCTRVVDRQMPAWVWDSDNNIIITCRDTSVCQLQHLQLLSSFFWLFSSSHASSLLSFVSGIGVIMETHL